MAAPPSNTTQTVRPGPIAKISMTTAVPAYRAIDSIQA